MPVENTNNSLSDLTNDDRLQFNTYVKDNNTEIDQSNEDEIKKKDSEIEITIASRNNAKNALDRAKIDSKISELRIERLDLLRKSENTIEWGSDAESMFDRNATIDYARIYDADANWKHYNKKKDGTFDRNSKVKNSNTPVPSDPQITSDGLSIRHLVQWSEKYPALQLRGQDFAYTKNLGVYPNNRLVVLRRFKNGVPDNLFDHYTSNSINKIHNFQPISTLVTWIKPHQDFIDMSFNEVWKDYEAGIIETIKNAASASTTDATSEAKATGVNLLMNSALSLLLEKVGNNDKDFLREDGVPFAARNLDGNPNLIKKSSTRRTGGEGLKSDISFNLDFEYEMRYINSIDPGIAMLDLITNCIRMGTSTAEFRFAAPVLKDNDIINKALNGNFEAGFKDFFSKITGFTKDIFKKLDDALKNGGGLEKKPNNNKTTNDTNPSSSGLNYIVSRYRENLKAAMALETGLPSGIWHVTIGNPKVPIISCGDLILKSSKLVLGKELGFNDFPNEFKITYTLGSARERGREDLSKIFNSGRGRVYVYDKYKHNPDYDSQDENKKDK